MTDEKRRVLIVEDDGHLLSGIRDILELEEYKVVTAQNGREGLEVLNVDPENPPDVIVSDIMMPHMNGFDFLREVRKETRWVNVPFIFLTAKGERADRNKGLLDGADEYLTKPFDAEDLLVAVKSTIDRMERIKAAQRDKVGKLQRDMLTMLNHETRTPLTLVVAYSEMLKEFDDANMSGDEVSMFLKGVSSGADRLRRLMENFLVVVEIDNGEAGKTVSWRKRPIQDIGVLIEDAHRQIAQPEQRPRNFVFNIEPNLPTLNLDAQYITMALREILDNAAKFCDNGDTIEVSAYRDGAYVAISVKDYGRGIPEGEIDRIWDRFYQINRQEFEDQGSGSGLWIADGLISLHGGDRSVVSEVGKGSTFTVRLPIAT